MAACDRNQSQPDGGVVATRKAPPARRWIALIVLCAIAASSMADRFILAILAPAIQHDLHLTDLQLGLLIGPAIAILYALMSVPLGHIADKTHRVRFLSICLALWSVCTSLGGWATNAWQLALSRLGVSAAEGGCVPASISLISDYFPPERRALASAIHATATSIGMFLAFGVGGLVAQHYGWRAALVAIGLPGVALAALSLVVLREPVRGGLDPASVPNVAVGSFLEKVRYLFGIAIYRRALLGAAFMYVTTAVVTGWGPTFLVRKFGASASLVGFNFGLALAVIGASSVLASGWMVNQIGLARFSRSLRLIAVLELGGLVFLLLALFAPDFRVALVSMSLLYGFGSLYLPTQLAIVQNYVPASMRATGSATASLVVILVVYGGVPPLVGALSDALQVRLGGQSLAIAMLVVAPAIVLSAIQYFRAAQVADLKA